MYAKKIQSVIWMDERAMMEGRGARRQFESVYLFSDGFSSEKELEDRVDELGLLHSSFLHLHFCSMWYAVTLNSYFSHAVIAKEKICFQTKAFSRIQTADAEGFDASRLIVTNRPVQDRKKWQDGICRDLKMADPGLELFGPDGKKYEENRIMWNNALITFGLGCFIREIKIATNGYVEHVLSNYYSDTSLSYLYDDIYRLRDAGYTYYNPFLQTASRTEKEKNKKEKELLGGVIVPPVIKREEILPGVKLMREREAFPTKIYDFSSRNFWRR